ncbi:MAG TPA: hypothetical protein VMF07_18880 [Solirubrobacteraceae bacterium]|nr:hypothetical protein [Solirubrobacteraceae bacterium]
MSVSMRVPDAFTISEQLTQSEPRAEAALIGRFVTIITPFFTLFAGWLAGVVAHAIPGLNLDRGQVVAFMVTASTATLTAAWKWLEGWQQHEQNVAEGKVAPLATPSDSLGRRLFGARASSPE